MLSFVFFGILSLIQESSFDRFLLRFQNEFLCRHQLTLVGRSLRLAAENISLVDGRRFEVLKVKPREIRVSMPSGEVRKMSAPARQVLLDHYTGLQVYQDGDYLIAELRRPDVWVPWQAKAYDIPAGLKTLLLTSSQRAAQEYARVVREFIDSTAAHEVLEVFQSKLLAHLQSLPLEPSMSLKAANARDPVKTLEGMRVELVRGDDQTLGFKMNGRLTKDLRGSPRAYNPKTLGEMEVEVSFLLKNGYIEMLVRKKSLLEASRFRQAADAFIELPKPKDEKAVPLDGTYRLTFSLQRFFSKGGSLDLRNEATALAAQNLITFAYEHIPEAIFSGELLREDMLQLSNQPGTDEMVGPGVRLGTQDSDRP